MVKSTKQTDKEKQNGKRKLLIPSQEVQELMEPIVFEDFAKLVAKIIPTSHQKGPMRRGRSCRYMLAYKRSGYESSVVLSVPVCEQFIE